MKNPPERLLCVANFAANTGYAWNFIEGLFARLADRLAEHGVETLVAYPSLPDFPRPLRGSAARPIQMDASLDTLASLRAVAELVRRENVRAIYYTDRPVRRMAYPLLRRLGVRSIVVHDHTSGERTLPRGAKRLAKQLVAAVPGVTADRVLAVSGYVARRQVEVGLVPPERVLRVWNSVRVPEGPPPPWPDDLALPPGDPVVVCTCRATPEKGVAHLMRAFDRMVLAGTAARLVYVGAGPQLQELRALRDSLASRERIVLAGHRADADALVAGADLCVVPSVWQEAFGLSVLEPMARARAVVASRVGGIPEIVENGRSGILVPPGDEAVLARAMAALLRDPDLRRALGEAGRRRAAELFSPEHQLQQLLEVVAPAFAASRSRAASADPAHAARTAPAGGAR